MIDPIQPVALSPATPAVRGAVASVPASPEASGAPSDAGRDAPASSSAKTPAISLSVDRDNTGVFVYTLTDSSSGRILAVIPRSAMVTTSQSGGEGVDIQA